MLQVGERHQMRLGRVEIVGALLWRHLAADRQQPQTIGAAVRATREKDGAKLVGLQRLFEAVRPQRRPDKPIVA